MRLARFKKATTAVLLAGSIALVGTACGDDDADVDGTENVDVDVTDEPGAGDDVDVTTAPTEPTGGETSAETTTG